MSFLRTITMAELERDRLDPVEPEASAVAADILERIDRLRPARAPT